VIRWQRNDTGCASHAAVATRAGHRSASAVAWVQVLALPESGVLPRARVRAQALAYEPLYRGLMGMEVAGWSLESPVADASAGR
jgi:hypothetical protein